MGFYFFGIIIILIFNIKGNHLKYLISSALILALALVGCSQNPQQGKAQVSTAPIQTQVIHFVGPMDLTLQLKSSDNFETAEMTDNSDRVIQLKAAVSGSGMRLANEDGVSIHFKNGEGIVEFIKDKPIHITEYKK